MTNVEMIILNFWAWIMATSLLIVVAGGGTAIYFMLVYLLTLTLGY